LCTSLESYYLLVNIAADSAVPDPLLLCSTLEIIYVFIGSDVSRPKVVSKTMDMLHEIAVLLPYVRDSKYKDADNMKYQDLWKQCEVKYGSESSAKLRMKELFDKDAKPSAWRARVQPIKRLQHPLMFRVLLGVIKLFELFIDKQDADKTGTLQTINMRLEEEWEREAMLFGPTSGLVACPDYDVKIQCLQCVQYAVRRNPSAIQLEEMGWLLRYLSSVGIGVGKQETFLMELVALLGLLTRDAGQTGHLFRSKFGKASIREAFEVLHVNCQRDCSGSEEEEEAQRDLGLKIISFVADCSRPLSGGLRQFLRNNSLMDTLQEIMRIEDTERNDSLTSEKPLLCTWIAREMRILLPMLTGISLRLLGVSRYRVLLKIADVLEGRLDYDPDDMFCTDAIARKVALHEASWWISSAQVHAQIRNSEAV